MSTPSKNADRTLKLVLTEAQKEELVRFIADGGQAKLDLDIAFEANIPARTVAPVALLVGNAI
jgi:hypothetical protein